jgi:adenine/guanine phosphoribosyltransferase-like PRPP-binding protein
MRLEAEIQLRIRFDDSGYFDNTRLISDPLLLERAVQQAVNTFAGTRITKILTPAVDGIALAILLAHRLGVNLVIAKKTREVGVNEFIEEIYTPHKSAMVFSLYVPRDALRRGDCVLIVDTVVDTGDIQMALATIVQSHGYMRIDRPKHGLEDQDGAGTTLPCRDRLSHRRETAAESLRPSLSLGGCSIPREDSLSHVAKLFLGPGKMYKSSLPHLSWVHS